MDTADNFSAVCIAVMVAGGFCPNLSAALLKDGIGTIPQFFRDNGRDIRVWIHDPFAFLQKGFLFGTIVQRLGFVSTVPPLVLGVGQHVFDG